MACPKRGAENGPGLGEAAELLTSSGFGVEAAKLEEKARPILEWLRATAWLKRVGRTVQTKSTA
jgi:hypothetical protein